ncbi:MAG: hypothetical protein ACYC6R_08185 [Anaerolineales bacterium]
MKMIYRLFRETTIKTVLYPAIIVVGVILAIYILAEKMFWFDFLSNTLATFVGIVVGIPTAVFLSAYQERESEWERKYKILRLVKEELLANQVQLEKWENSGDKQKDGLTLHALLKTESWRAFSDGGEIEWIKSLDLLGVISEAYYSIRSAQTLSERYFETRMLSNATSLHWAELAIFSKLENSVSDAGNVLRTTLRIIDEEIGSN